MKYILVILCCLMLWPTNALAQSTTPPANTSGGVPVAPGAPASPAATGQGFDLFGMKLAIPNLSGVCTTCTIVGRLVENIDALGRKMNDQIRSGVLGLIGLSVAFMLFWNGAKLLFPFMPLNSTGQLYNRMVSQTGIALIVAGFIGSFVGYWDYVFQPVVTSGLNITSAVMDQARTAMNTTTSGNVAGQMFACSSGSAPLTTAATSPQIAQSLSCVLTEMQQTIGFAIEQSLNGMFSSVNIITVAPAILGGLILAFFYIKIFLSLPVRIVDVVIRWTIFSVLSPLFFAAMILPVTRSFAFSGIKSLFQGVLELFLYALVIALAGYAIRESIGTVPYTPVSGGVGNAAAAVGQNLVMGGVLYWQLFLIAFTTDTVMSKIKDLSRVMAGTDFGLTVLNDISAAKANQIVALTGAAKNDLLGTLRARFKK
jgi:hypothetical protein